MPSLHLWWFCCQLGTAREAGCGSICSSRLCLCFPVVCDLPIEVAELLCLEEGWNSGGQNVPWARKSGLGVVNLVIPLYWDLGNTPCLYSPTKVFLQWSAWAAGMKLVFQWECGRITSPASGGASSLLCPKRAFLARLKKSLPRNPMCKRYAAPSPSAEMSTGSSTTSWSSSGSVGSLQTQTTCSWETTWTEAIIQWRQ